VTIHSKDQYLDLQDGEIFVRQWIHEDCQSDEPVVLMHDSLGCVDMWRDFPSTLAALLKRPILAYDRLGFGQSSPCKELPELSFVEDEAFIYFPQIIQALELKAFSMIGHSVGGGMSLLIAASQLDLCQRVVSISAQAFVEQRTIDGVQQAKLFFQDKQQFSRLEKWHKNNARWVLDAWTESWLNPKMHSWSLLPKISTVECPTLIIHGDNDEYGSIEFPKSIANSVKGQSILEIIPNCGHMPHKEHKSSVLATIKKFYIDAT